MEKKYTQDDMDEMRDKTLEAGKKIGEGHNSSAPETRERLAIVETKQNDIMQEIQEIKQMVKELGIKLDCVIEKKADKVDLAGKSDKWVERTFRWFLIVVGAGFLGVLGTLIYQAIIHFNQ